MSPTRFLCAISLYYKQKQINILLYLSYEMDERLQAIKLISVEIMKEIDIHNKISSSEFINRETHLNHIYKGLKILNENIQYLLNER